MFRNYTLLTIILTTLTVSPVSAKEVSAITLQQLLERVKEGRVTDNNENKKRETIFRNSVDRQRSLLERVNVAIKKQESRSERIEAVFNENEVKIAEIEGVLNERLGVFGELFGIVRQVSGEMKAQIKESVISGEHKGRESYLDVLSNTKEIPSIKQLEGLWYVMQQEMTSQGEIKRFMGSVIGTTGVSEAEEIVRVGPFVALSDGRFLRYAGNESFVELGRQPPARFVNAAEELFEAEPGELTSGVIDPSRGALLNLFLQTPTFSERLGQGGVVGYIIIVFGICGILFALIRIFQLSRVYNAVRKQLETLDFTEGVVGNTPLSRIWSAYNSNLSVDVETLELKLDEAILKEIPALEKGLSLVKLIAGLAPLMGLLGTVTGMILTFQAITLFGTGDPKLMAGGISQALMTTVLGLCVAIPTLLFYSVASTRSREVIQILEEQSAGLIAAHAEQNNNINISTNVTMTPGLQSNDTVENREKTVLPSQQENIDSSSDVIVAQTEGFSSSSSDNDKQEKSPAQNQGVNKFRGV